MDQAAQLTVDEMRLLLAPAIARAAAFDGWTELAVRSAAGELHIEPGIARLAFPGGAMDMIAAWIARVDADMEKALLASLVQDLPVRERIRRLVGFRLEAMRGLEEGLRRALAIMAMPANASRAVKAGWATADRMWRLAGDQSTDFNHYSKRAILAGVYAATLLVFVDDGSEGKAETLAFLDRRIAGIIGFEKAKARLIPDPDQHFSLARFLGRLRYPAR